MREHMGLYRGKREDGGEFLYGSLATFRNVRNELYIAIIPSEDGENQIIKLKRVDPDTVGECTGLPDKNGKLIFEGDIFHFDDDCVGVVIFKDGCFRVQVYDVRESDTEDGYSEDCGWGIVECEPIDWYYVKDLVIVGNVHDNPELLEGAGKDAAD